LKNIAKYIDHTCLKPDAIENEIKNLCTEAINYEFASVCINPLYVPLAVKHLKGKDPKVCSVIGFPLGSISTEMKFAEAMLAIHQGVDELDMVINIGNLKQGNFKEINDEVSKIVRASADIVIKVIIETCLLNDKEIVNISKLIKNSGADFVKTSTGFSHGGATVEDIRLIRKSVGSNFGVKASGGISSLLDLNNMINAGANRIGTSSGVKILNE
jgi:deoxyribose-phosphate aldolase